MPGLRVLPHDAAGNATHDNRDGQGDAYNAAGRPVFVTNSMGARVWEATDLPFGGVHTTTGFPIGLRFPGQWSQLESGLHQNWMRDYDPTTGRYLQADPLGLVDGAPVYGYVGQNPGRYVDPRGEQANQASPVNCH